MLERNAPAQKRRKFRCDRARNIAWRRGGFCGSVTSGTMINLLTSQPAKGQQKSAGNIHFATVVPVVIKSELSFKSSDRSIFREFNARASSCSSFVFSLLRVHRSRYGSG